MNGQKQWKCQFLLIANTKSNWMAIKIKLLLVNEFMFRLNHRHHYPIPYHFTSEIVFHPSPLSEDTKLKLSTNMNAKGRVQNYNRIACNVKTVLNPYPWILGKKSKPRDHHRVCFAGKNPERSIEKICICFRAVDFFSKNDARPRSQKMAYIFVQHGIFPLILAYAIWN